MKLLDSAIVTPIFCPCFVNKPGLLQERNKKCFGEMQANGLDSRQVLFVQRINYSGAFLNDILMPFQEVGEFNDQNNNKDQQRQDTDIRQWSKPANQPQRHGIFNQISQREAYDQAKEGEDAQRGEKRRFYSQRGCSCSEQGANTDIYCNSK